jgi:hypothetical protein
MSGSGAVRALHASEHGYHAQGFGTGPSADGCRYAFSTHARNYLSEEPKLPSPQIDPQDVARAILKASEEPERDVKVGGTAVLKTAMAKLMPKLADKMGTKMVDQQIADEPARDPEGTLYKPGESGRTRGTAYEQSLAE